MGNRAYFNKTRLILNFSILRIARRSAAIIFIFAGSFKLLLFAVQVLAPGRVPSFTALLQVLGVPFPLFFALMVPLLEISGGINLWRDSHTRIWAALLAGDMSVAIATVGVPALLGRAPKINGVAFGTEAWRLPLEAALLLICLRLALKR